MKSNSKIDWYQATGIILMAAVFILMFTPYWTIGENSASLSQYVWLPQTCTWLTESMKATFGEGFMVNRVVPMSVIQLITSTFGIWFYIKRPHSLLTTIVAGICGLFGVFGIILEPAFRTGSIWVLYFIVSAIVTALAIYALIDYIKERNAD